LDTTNVGSGLHSRQDRSPTSRVLTELVNINLFFALR
jgi:hypothetical protein